MVYVQNKNGFPLMPCHMAVARKLLRQNKAYIVRRDVFTIRMRYGSSGYKQKTILGIDAGTKHIGFSVTTKNKELINGTAELRTDIVSLISTRKMLRRARRNRKTRYRKERFNNRVASKRDNWFAPSIRQKIFSHIRLVFLINKILPIHKIIVEIANFDIQKIKNLNIKGEQYQHGEQYGFDNLREYILYRDKHKCQYCGGKSKDSVLQIHHIESRKTGGNSPSNLITLCKTCHELYHKKLINLGIKREKSFREASFMNIMRFEIVNELQKYFNNVECTYGHITKHDRISIGLPKEHYNDAFCITKNFNAKKLNKHYVMSFVPRHKRILHTQKPQKGGIRHSMNANYWLKDSCFTRYDKVLFNGRICFITGSSHGKAILRDINKNKIENSRETIPVKELKLISHCRSNIMVI